MLISIEDFIKSATKEQKELLFKLSETAKQEKKLEDEINYIYNSIKSGTYSQNGHSITVCEDKDDASVISMKPREKLKGVKEQMKAYMEKAVELGMEDLGLIQRNYEHYVGKSLLTK